MGVVVQIVLSSVVFAALINFAAQNKNNQLKYFAEQNHEWHKEIVGLIRRIETVISENSMHRIIVELKSQLNAYGKRYDGYENDLKLDIVGQEHIWKLLSEMEEKSSKEQRSRLADYLSLLIQFQKEKVKKRFVPKYGRIIFVGIYIINMITWIYQMYCQGKKLGKVDEIVEICFAYVFVQICALICIILKDIINKMKSLRIPRWYEITNGEIAQKTFGVMMMFFSDIIVYLVLFDKYDYTSETLYIQYACKAINIFGMVCIEWDDNSVYNTYCRKVMRCMGYKPIKVYAKKEGIFVNHMLGALQGWNVYYAFCSTKAEENLKRIPAELREEKLIVEYDGKYKKIGKKGDIVKLLEDIAGNCG